MCRRIDNLFVLAVILCLAVALASCGGKGPTGARELRDGRIYVKNDCTVIYFDVTLKHGERVVKTHIEPDEKKEISDGVIEGGTKLTVIMDGGGSNYLGVGIIMDDPTTLSIVVDGNVTIRATAVNFVGDQWRADYEILGGG